MAASVAMFCSHKRLKTSCRECTPTLSVPSALRDDEDVPVARRARR